LLQQIIQELKPTNTTLIAVSKTKPIADIKALYLQGQMHFGENKVQEMVEKYEQLPKEIQWHLIGHLQSNKVKFIVPFVHTIHSVDSIKLMQEINKEAAKIYRRVNILLQFHIAQEDTKFGLDLQEAMDLCELVVSHKEEYQYINICGVMGMATFTENTAQIAEEFKELKINFTILKNTYFPFSSQFKEVSMGMSSDYKIAIENGSTMVRIGSLLFGNR
jgi:PLP dependent protein